MVISMTVLIISVVLAHSSLGHDREDDGPQVLRGEILQGGPAGLAKSSRDTTTVFGGPGTLEGKFEDSAGHAQRQGWTGEDFTENDTFYWHPSTFHAAGLDPGTPDNHAWWCGTTMEPCGPDDPEAGYGNNWNQWLVWTGQVLNPAQPVTVNVSAVVAWDTEPGYDIFMFEVGSANGYELIWSNDGQRGYFLFDESFTVQPADFAGDLGDEIHLRWRFKSDGAYSDEDCLHPTEYGAAQADLIVVTFDQGDGPIQIGPTETAEPGDPSSWTPMVQPGAGDFTQIWEDLEDIDACFSNHSPALAFIDDGLVVPGTGGSPCISWCYGPGGFVVNHTGGLAGIDTPIHNAAWSPPISLPGDPITGAVFAFDVYEHNGFGIPNTAEVFWVWYLDSTADPAGEIGWTGPTNRNFIQEGGPGWRRQVNGIGDLLTPDARWVRLGLGVRQRRFGWHFGNESTPAPYFDNVRLDLFPPSGPALTASKLDLAQDAYPTSGSIDPENLGAASVRFDSALNTSSDDASVVAGDSLLVQVNTMGPDATLTEPARLHYHLVRNPLFDPYRSASLPDLGHVEGDTVYYHQHTGVIRYAFDLPDEGFLFPGDQLRYYVIASEPHGGEVLSTILPADTTGFSSGQHYHKDFVFRALPSLHSTDLADRPTILFWDRSDDYRTRQAWVRSLGQLGLLEGVDYDLFSTRSPNQMQANSLAFKASEELLAGYDIIIAESGERFFTFSGDFDPNGHPNPYPDTAALETWLALGQRSLLVVGDQISRNLNEADSDFLAETIGGSPAGDGHFIDDLGGQITPPVLTLEEAPWPVDLDGWTASGCTNNAAFYRGRVTGIVPAGPNSMRLAAYGSADHNPEAYPYAALLLNQIPGAESQVVTLAHSLARVQSDQYHGAPETPLPAQALLLGEILEAFGQPAGLWPVPVSETPQVLAMSAYPNPFNPALTLQLAVPRTGPVEVAVFDLRGRRVRELLKGQQQAGRMMLRWDGADDRGRSMGAGVYFVRMVTTSGEKVVKIALVK